MLRQTADAAFEFQVVNVRAIPRQEILHPMHGGEGDVEGIGCSFWRDDVARQQPTCERIGFGRVGKLWNSCQHAEPFAGEFGVAFRGLAHHDRRDEQVKFVAVKVPPILGSLLVGANSRQSAAPCDEVAGDGCFEVKAGFHRSD